MSSTLSSASSGTAPLWPARLDHVKITSPQPAVLLDFYRGILGGTVSELTDGQWLLAGAQRRVVIGSGPAKKLGYAAYVLDDEDRLAALRDGLAQRGVPIKPSPSRVFGDEAFAVEDPDHNFAVFGLPAEAGGPAKDHLPGRLQHVVVATENLPAMTDFYADTVGFRLSDRVVDDAGDTAVAFFRADPEHHSFACFRARARQLDHFCFETTCWNDIRDWADYLATLRIPVGWGPGRHGPGNNLFFMLNDPDGNAFEFSAEIEHMPYDMATREWPHEQRTLNYWGSAWMRS
jgi:catechol 2,3-dioxygenase-like lactoylglutathione lyase family enzyme